MASVITLIVPITNTNVLATETRHTSVVQVIVLGMYHRTVTATTHIAHLEVLRRNAINIKPGISKLRIRRRLDVR